MEYLLPQFNECPLINTNTNANDYLINNISHSFILTNLYLYVRLRAEKIASSRTELSVMPWLKRVQESLLLGPTISTSEMI